MVYVEHKDNPGYYYGIWDDKSGERRKNIVYDAAKEAETEVKSDYPYAVFRRQEEVARQAERMYQQWIAIQNKVIEHRLIKEEWYSTIDELKRLYISAFIGKYIEEVAEKDKKEGKRPTYTSTTGATITVTSVDRSNPNAYVYYVELVDPEYIDGVFQPEPLTVVLEPEAPTASSASSFSTSASDASSSPQKWINNISTRSDRTTASSSSNSGLASSFSDTTRASASSDAIPSRIQQRGRKPIRSHWGKQ